MNVRLKRAKELAGYAVQLTKEEGLPTMVRRGAGFVKRRCFGKRARYLPAKKVLEAQRAEMAGKTAADCGLPTISVLTPLYNTPEKYLREFLDSFVGQTAPNGQLCLADASDAAHGDVERIVKEYQQKNQQIVYKKIENKGIAANTNAAAQLATGEYLALADHDDILAPHALYTMGKAILQLRQRGEPDGFLYSDEALFTKSIRRPMVAHFKPDYAPDYLLCCNYICHLAVFQKALWEQLGGERPECDGSQDHDMILRLTAKAKHIVHIPRILYYWRSHKGSVASSIDAKTYAIDAAKGAVADHLTKLGYRNFEIESTRAFATIFRIKYELTSRPLVSIIIPNKDHIDDLKRCMDSIDKKSTYQNYEYIIVENNSTDDKTFAYYKELEASNPKAHVVYWDREFNYSAINNYGASFAKGEYLLLLNNDTEIINPDCLEELLGYCMRKDVGAVGARLYYEDDTIQHAGVVIGFGGIAGHCFVQQKRGTTGYCHRIICAQDYSAVTAACMMVKKSAFDAVGGLSEELAVAFNDIDFCMKLRKAGYLIVYNPYAELYHYESKSRGLEDTPEKVARFNKEIATFEKKWPEILKNGDPYYNPNLTLKSQDFSLKRI